MIGLLPTSAGFISTEGKSVPISDEVWGGAAGEPRGL